MAGRTGLPLSIWPGVPGPGCPAPDSDYPPCPHRCPGLRAWPVITTFSRPGDLVAVIPAAACPALAAAAASAGRRILGVTAGPPGPGEQAGQQSPVRRSGASPGALPGASCAAGQAALAITLSSGGRSPADGLDAAETAPYTACHRVLRPGGVLAVIASRPAPGGIPDLGLAVACARAAGLVYAQHIILVHAAIAGGQLRPFPSPDLTAPGPQDGPPAARIHTDLLIFTKLGRT